MKTIQTTVVKGPLYDCKYALVEVRMGEYQVQMTEAWSNSSAPKVVMEFKLPTNNNASDLVEVRRLFSLARGIFTKAVGVF